MDRAATIPVPPGIVWRLVPATAAGVSEYVKLEFEAEDPRAIGMDVRGLREGKGEAGSGKALGCPSPESSSMFMFADCA